MLISRNECGTVTAFQKYVAGSKVGFTCEADSIAEAMSGCLSNGRAALRKDW